MKRVALEDAFVLYRRLYQEHGFLLELFTYQYGRVSAVVRGKQIAGIATRGLLQPFVPLLVSWSGKGELKTLSSVEVNGKVPMLYGNCLYAGLYLNELLTYLLAKWDPYPSVYRAYQRTLLSLESNILEQKALRIFEKNLLEELGYGLFPKNANAQIMDEQIYCFLRSQGLVLHDGKTFDSSLLFSGKSLLAFINEEWQDKNSLLDAKRLMRLALHALLGEKQINSRQLFRGK